MLAGVAISGVEYLGKTRVDPIIQTYEETQARHLTAYREDQEFLQPLPLFQQATSQEKDAGPFLNPRLVWEPELDKTHTQSPRLASTETTAPDAADTAADSRLGASSGSDQADGNATEDGPVVDRSSATPDPKSFVVARELAADVLRYRSDWMRHYASLLQNAKLDFSIFKTLSQFDFWDLEKQSPIGDLISSGRLIPPEFQPAPGTLNLLVLVKLRLATGVQKKEPLTALHEVRSLAKLLLTTENLHLVLSGLAVLDTERIALNYYVEHGLLAEDAWQPVSGAITRRASRAIGAARGYLKIWTDPKLLNEFFLSQEEPVGFCAAVNQEFPKILALRSRLEPQLPFERRYTEPYAVVDQISKRAFAKCRIRYLKKMVELDRFRTDYPLPGLLTTVPYLRKVFSARIATLPFLGFEGYEGPRHSDRQ